MMVMVMMIIMITVTDGKIADNYIGILIIMVVVVDNGVNETIIVMKAMQGVQLINNRLTSFHLTLALLL